MGGAALWIIWRRQLSQVETVCSGDEQEDLCYGPVPRRLPAILQNMRLGTMDTILLTCQPLLDPF